MANAVRWSVPKTGILPQNAPIKFKVEDMKHENLPRSLWVVNLPPLTYPPRNTALLRAYKPLVSLSLPRPTVSNVSNTKLARLDCSICWQNGCHLISESEVLWLKEFSGFEGWELGFGLYKKLGEYHWIGMNVYWLYLRRFQHTHIRGMFQGFVGIFLDCIDPNILFGGYGRLMCC